MQLQCSSNSSKVTYEMKKALNNDNIYVVMEIENKAVKLSIFDWDSATDASDKVLNI